MKKLFSLLAAVLFAGSMMAAESVVYTLTPASGSNNSYAGNCDIEIAGITWNLTGNSTMQPWRLGGKSITGVDRELYSKTAIEDNVSKIEIEHGTAANIEVNSFTVIVASDAEFTNVISSFTPEFVVSTVTTIERPEGADWSNAYYKFVYNVTVAGTSNKFIQFVGAKFYADGDGGDVPPTPDYFLVGTNNGWDGTGYQFAENPGAEGEYMLDVTFAAADEFKVIGVLDGDTTWFPEGTDNNYIVNEAGEYTVYFRPEYQEAWENFYTIVPKVAQDIEVNISEGLRYDDYVATDGWWQIYGNDEHFAVSISNLSTTQAEGIYTIDDLDADYTYITAINSTDTTHFVDGSVTLSIDAQTGNVTVAGTLVGDDGNNYIFNLQFIVPTPQETVNVNIQNAELIDYYADYGLYGVYGTDANGVYVQLAVWVDEAFQGQFTEEDLDMQYIGSGLMIGDAQEAIYTAAITVTPGNGGDYNITATLLCYNNTQYNVTMYVSATADGLEGVDAAVKAIKTLVNGNVVIEKNGVKYSVNGQIVK